MSSNEAPFVATDARRWVVRLDDLSATERVQLEGWLRESDVHRAEFEAAREQWQSLDFLKLLQEEPVKRGDPWVARKRVRRERSRRYTLSMAAAAALVAVGLAVTWVMPRDYRAEYFTAIGEQQEYRLPDDSTVLLNTNTSVTVNFTAAQRTVRLERGEAHFDVAHDAARPFVVVAGTRVVRAVGTAFNVYVHEEQVEVTVTDGVVEISQRPEPASASAAGTVVPVVRAAPVQRPPVQRLTVAHTAKISRTAEAVAAVDPETLERRLAWQHGMLEFVNAPLSEVVAEAGRYTSKTLVIKDPELDAYPVTVIAKASNIDSLLENLDGSTDAFDVTRVSNNRVIISVPRRQTAPAY